MARLGIVAGIPALWMLLALLLTANRAPAQEASVFAPFEGARPASEFRLTDIASDAVVAGRVVATHRSTGDRVPYRLVLHRGNQRQMELVYWPDEADLIHGSLGMPSIGTRISAEGRLEEFNGNLQIRIRGLKQIRIEGYPHTLSVPEAGASASAAAVPEDLPQPGPDGYYRLGQIPEMRQHLLGRDLSLKGTFQEYNTPSNERAPHVFVLSEGGQSIQVIFWSPEDQSELGTPGQVAYATGEFGEYQGRLQLNIPNPGYFSHEPLPAERVVLPRAALLPGEVDIREGWPGRAGGTEYLETTRVELEPGTRMRLRQIGPSHEGDVITTEGTVRAVVAGSDGLWIIIHDLTGYLRVLVPGSVYREMDDPRIAVNDRLRMRTLVVYSEARASVELRIQDASDVEVIPPED